MAQAPFWPLVALSLVCYLGSLRNGPNFVCVPLSLIFDMVISKTNFQFGYWLFLLQSSQRKLWFCGADWTAVVRVKLQRAAVCQVLLWVA